MSLSKDLSLHTSNIAMITFPCNSRYPFKVFSSFLYMARLVFSYSGYSLLSAPNIALSRCFNVMKYSSDGSNFKVIFLLQKDKIFVSC